MTTSTTTVLSDRAAESRARILEAALKEFSAQGLAGARMDTIASIAGVNKALLYYYFESKEKLYLAAFEAIAARIRDTTMDVFLRQATPGERVLRAALNHFDRILTQHEFQNLLQQEMMRLHKGESGAMPILVKRVFTPVLTMYQSMVREGIESGELIDVDWLQMHLATLGTNVFFFLSAPIMRLVLPTDPYTPEAIEERRKAIVWYLGQAIFRDRQHGMEIAKKVLADCPMPDVDWDRVNLWRKNERAK
ncbi:MAG TPA: TetR/AcrR family transcriptional regulator [Terracidiphilus sp.]|nr:TetR/AcrR family transcriptional regulator [Terracidiphilus sp.]